MIKLGKSGDYAIKAVIYIAESGELVKIKHISENLKISEGFLRRIVANLEKGGIISSTKGRAGGVKIAKEINKISMYDILISAGEDLHLTGCTAGEECPNKSSCNTTRAFNSLQKGITSLLKMHTLDKIINNK